MRNTILTIVLGLATSLAMAAVDVNTASEADLDSIKGIGPGTSGKLIAARKNSTFKDWADLITRVPGIGPKRAVQLSAQGLTVNGNPFQPAVSTDKAAPKAQPPAATKP